MGFLEHLPKVLSFISMYSGVLGLLLPFILRKTKVYRKIRFYKKWIYIVSSILTLLGMCGVTFS